MPVVEMNSWISCIYKWLCIHTISNFAYCLFLCISRVGQIPDTIGCQVPMTTFPHWLSARVHCGNHIWPSIIRKYMQTDSCYLFFFKVALSFPINKFPKEINILRNKHTYIMIHFVNVSNKSTCFEFWIKNNTTLVNLLSKCRQVTLF